jgi:hypothetical protein
MDVQTQDLSKELLLQIKNAFSDDTNVQPQIDKLLQFVE